MSVRNIVNKKFMCQTLKSLNNEYKKKQTNFFFETKDKQISKCQ